MAAGTPVPAAATTPAVFQCWSYGGRIGDDIVCDGGQAATESVATVASANATTYPAGSRVQQTKWKQIVRTILIIPVLVAVWALSCHNEPSPSGRLRAASVASSARPAFTRQMPPSVSPWPAVEQPSWTHAMLPKPTVSVFASCSTVTTRNKTSVRAECPSTCIYSSICRNDPANKFCVTADLCRIVSPSRPWGRVSTRMCTQACGTREGASNTGVGDQVIGCLSCVEAGVCQQCYPYFSLKANGRMCSYDLTKYWYTYMIFFSSVVLVFVWWVAGLYTRPVVNPNYDKAKKHRALARALHFVSVDEGVPPSHDVRTLFHTWSLFTCIFRFDISGQGVTLYFRWVHFWQATIVVLFVGFLLAYEWPRTAEDKEEAALLRAQVYLSLYVIVVLSSLWFSYLQFTKSASFEQKHAYHSDFAVWIEKLPVGLTNTCELHDWLVSACEWAASKCDKHQPTPKVVGVSIAYDFRGYEGKVEQAIDEWIEELDEQREQEDELPRAVVRGGEFPSDFLAQPSEDSEVEMLEKIETEKEVEVKLEVSPTEALPPTLSLEVPASSLESVHRVVSARESPPPLMSATIPRHRCVVVEKKRRRRKHCEGFRFCFVCCSKGLRFFKVLDRLTLGSDAVAEHEIATKEAARLSTMMQRLCSSAGSWSGVLSDGRRPSALSDGRPSERVIDYKPSHLASYNLSWLSDIQSSGTAFVVLDRQNAPGLIAEAFRRKDAPEFPFEGMHYRLKFTKVDETQPIGVAWEGFYRDSMFRGALRKLKFISLVFLTCFIYIVAFIPWAYYSVNLDPVPGITTNFLEDNSLALLIAFGNMLSSRIADFAASIPGFKTKDSRDACVVVIAAFSSLQNILGDFGATIYLAMRSESSSAQKLSQDLFGLIRTSYLLLPVILVPIVERLVQVPMFRLAASYRLRRRSTERMLEMPSFDIRWRYADCLTNFTVVMSLGFFPTEQGYIICLFMMVSVGLMYIIDHVLLLKNTSMTPYVSGQTSQAFACLWVVPSGLILTVATYWYAKSRKEDSVRVAIFFFLAHSAFYLQVVMNMIRKCREARKAGGHCEFKRAYNYLLDIGDPATYWNTNPMFCLRSRAEALGQLPRGSSGWETIKKTHMFDSGVPGCTPYVRGKTYLQVLSSSLELRQF
eukprot:TRINITY_DN5158_c0_g3_i3.p1 TRINITY_DN5158_c0_g3~~TRINITY_DN5158_c0_g3_i3.p1  ORF type:complete len:1142 (+),score=125.43 TRINITY_DN5158_c0_g3_i3:71-3496(+)